MTYFFATITQVGQFKWELDVAANRAGQQGSPEHGQEQEGRIGLDDPYAFDVNQGIQALDVSDE